MIDASVIADLKYAAMWTGAMIVGFLVRKLLISESHDRPPGPTDTFVRAYPIRGFLVIFSVTFLFINVLDSIWLVVATDPTSSGMTTIGQYVFSIGITAAVLVNFFFIRNTKTNKTNAGRLSETDQ